jgi:hypothetical protein
VQVVGHLELLLFLVVVLHQQHLELVDPVEHLELKVLMVFQEVMVVLVLLVLLVSVFELMFMRLWLLLIRGSNQMVLRWWKLYVLVLEVVAALDELVLLLPFEMVEVELVVVVTVE